MVWNLEKGDWEEVPFRAEGEFLATLTGFSSNPSFFVDYKKFGDIVSLSFPTVGVVGLTSNTNSLGLEGLPKILWPSRQVSVPCLVQDEVHRNGEIIIGTGGFVIFAVEDPATGAVHLGAFNPASTSKGVVPGGMVVYRV